MSQFDFLEPALVWLANLQVILNKKEEFIMDSELFEEILYIQESILQKFGLTFTQENDKLVTFNSIPSEDELKDIITQLHNTATQYLLSDAKSELQILREAQQKMQNPFNVLPELNFETHVYTIFIYERILLKKKDSLENILHELKISNNHEILNSLGQIKNGTKKQDSVLIAKLNSFGLRYLKRFLNYKSKIIDWEMLESMIVC